MKPINLEMSDPLTLGLGHPIAERIRRLPMRKTNTLMLGGTSALILSVLTLTAVTSNAAVKPVTDIVTDLSATQFKRDNKIIPESVSIISTQPPIKMAELAKPRASTHTGLKPMRLRMSPRFTPEQIVKTEARRQSVNKKEDGAMKKLNGTFANILRNNRYQVIISDDGFGSLKISKGQGGWPGYPKINTDWLSRPMSADMHNSLKAIFKRCAAAAVPVYFLAVTQGGDSDIGQGDYEVECVPGTAAQQKNVSGIDLANAMLASSDFSLRRRQAGFGWRMPISVIKEYVKTTPNATIAGDRLECVRIHTSMKQKYAFMQGSSDRHLEKCATTNYNWVRKGDNIPAVQ